MTLATADADGAPNARMVLLKGFGTEGLRFFSNYESVKGAELEARPRAALVIYWRELDRQVARAGPRPQADRRAVRRVLRVAAPTGAKLRRRSRPRAGRSSATSSTGCFEEARGVRRRWAHVPRPSTGAATPLEPEEMEFWQGREDRMHDRFRYTREGGGWRIERLAP